MCFSEGNTTSEAILPGDHALKNGVLRLISFTFSVWGFSIVLSLSDSPSFVLQSNAEIWKAIESNQGTSERKGRPYPR